MPIPDMFDATSLAADVLPKAAGGAATDLAQPPNSGASDTEGWKKFLMDFHGTSAKLEFGPDGELQGSLNGPQDLNMETEPGAPEPSGNQPPTKMFSNAGAGANGGRPTTGNFFYDNPLGRFALGAARAAAGQGSPFSPRAGGAGRGQRNGMLAGRQPNRANSSGNTGVPPNGSPSGSRQPWRPAKHFTGGRTPMQGFRPIEPIAPIKALTSPTPPLTPPVGDRHRPPDDRKRGSFGPASPDDDTTQLAAASDKVMDILDTGLNTA